MASTVVRNPARILTRYSSSAESACTSVVLDTASKRSSTNYKSTRKTEKSSSYLGGSEHTTVKKNAKATFTVTARSLGWVATKDKTGGSVAVYIDGKKISTVSLYSPSKTTKQMMFTYTWTKPGKHTITLINLTSGGRKRLTGCDVPIRAGAVHITPGLLLQQPAAGTIIDASSVIVHIAVDNLLAARRRLNQGDANHQSSADTFEIQDPDGRTVRVSQRALSSSAG